MRGSENNEKVYVNEFRRAHTLAITIGVCARFLLIERKIVRVMRVIRRTRIELSCETVVIVRRKPESSAREFF